MPEIIVECDGMFQCSTDFCGGTHFTSKADVIKCFNCDCCEKYMREGLKIIDRRSVTKLDRWLQ